MQGETFREVMTEAMHTLTMLRSFPGYLGGCGTPSPASEMAVMASMFSESRMNPQIFEFIHEYAERLQCAHDTPGEAVPFVEAFAKVAKYTGPEELQCHGDVEIDAPASNEEDDFSTMTVSFPSESQEMFSFQGLFGDIEMLTGALDELQDASRSNAGLQRFSLLILQELNPFVEMALDQMGELRQMLDGLNELFEKDAPDEDHMPLYGDQY